MLQVFARAFAAVAGAFLLGLAVGWLIWRLHRRSVPGDEWSASQKELEDLRRMLAEVEGQRDHMAHQVASWQAETSGLQARISSAWHEREVARAHADALQSQLHQTSRQLQQALAQSHHLQRRVSELSLMVSRGAVVRPDLRRPHAPLIGPPQPPATPGSSAAGTTAGPGAPGPGLPAAPTGSWPRQAAMSAPPSPPQAALAGSTGIAPPAAPTTSPPPQPPGPPPTAIAVPSDR